MRTVHREQGTSPEARELSLNPGPSVMLWVTLAASLATQLLCHPDLSGQTRPSPLCFLGSITVKSTKSVCRHGHILSNVHIHRSCGLFVLCSKYHVSNDIVLSMTFIMI